MRADEEDAMGLFDKVKNAAKGRGQQLKGGVDKAATAAKSKLDDKHAGKVDGAVGKAKEGIDRLDPPVSR